MTGPIALGDLTIIGDLLQTIEQDHYCIPARKLLAEQYEKCGWMDAAMDEMRSILLLAPDEEDATAWLANHQRLEKSMVADAIPLTRPTATTFDEPVALITTLSDLEEGYKSLMSNATDLVQEFTVFQERCGGSVADAAVHVADARALSHGQFSSIFRVKPAPSARAAAEKIKLAEVPQDAAFNDLDACFQWTRRQTSDMDHIRDTIKNRVLAIKVSLPDHLSHIPDVAFMHIEHELLGKTYQNEDGQTMLGDSIATIPRSHFWASEDGYGWDMAELVEALKINKGVMRNPLSRLLFTAQDVREIVQHTLGKGLAALQVQQQHLTQGVRKATVQKLDSLATMLLADQSADASPSREAVDEFLTYMATLPQAEQTALNDLRIPAKDKHTGLPFDVSIGDAVNDAKANKQCFHKTGDLIAQAAQFLRSNAPDHAKMPGAWE